MENFIRCGAQGFVQEYRNILKHYKKRLYFIRIHILTEVQNINLHCTTYKVNKPRHKQRAVTPHFSAGQTLFKKYREKINVDIINSGKLFDRSVYHK